MPWVIRWHHWSFAGAVDQRPAGSGLQVVVVGTQRVELVEPGVPGLRPGFAVVVLGRVRQHPATVQPGLAQARAIFWPRLARGRGGHVQHIHPAGDHQMQTERPSSCSATDTGTGPTPRISHSSSPATRPRCSACTSTRSNARYRGFNRPGSLRRRQVSARLAVTPITPHQLPSTVPSWSVPLVGPQRVRPVGRRVPSARRRRRPAPARCGRLGGRW